MKLHFCAAGPLLDFLSSNTVEYTGDNVRKHIFTQVFVLHATAIN